ncbi:MAG: hypothetical protein ACXV8N_20255 [Ilumatobacteraceae bacterium]
MSGTVRRLSLAAVAVLLYLVLLLAVWATRPLHDSVAVALTGLRRLRCPHNPSG